jgi:hypothetical protein
MIKFTKEQKKTLQKLRTYYCTNLAEDPIDGTWFDNLVLDVLYSIDKIEVNKTDDKYNICTNIDWMVTLNDKI